MMASSLSPECEMVAVLKEYGNVVNTKFEFLRIGPLCNAYRGYCFSDAVCDIERIESPRIPEFPLCIRINYLFDRAYKVLQAEESKETAVLREEEKRAIADLKKFLLNIETHRKNILNAYEKMKTEVSKETILSIALAEHLFCQLASGYSYSIDARAQGKVQNKTCKCGCNKPVNYDATGVGHHKVWHGFVDILIHGNKDPVGTAKVVTDPLSSDAGGDFGPTSAKRSKTEDEDCPAMSSREGSSISEVKLKIKGKWDQAVAQTIVFGLAQNQRHPNIKSFIPNILICQKEFYIIMYDPVNDILISSGAISLWKNHSPTSLNFYAVITLWMVIHYKLFCKGGEILENIHEVKAGFFDRILEEKKDFYSQLAIGVSNFETEDEHYHGHHHGDGEDFEHVKVKVN